MLDSIFSLPNSPATFILTIVITCILILIVIAFYLHINLFVGLTLSQWIEKTRLKPDASSANMLKRVRQHLEILAHDVLKHRFMGLQSLAQSIKKNADDNGKIKLTPEQLDDLRKEIFRLCGVRSAPSDRLWQKWKDTFSEIRHLTHNMLLSPFVDPTLKWTTYVMFRLRRMFALYITKDRADAFTPEAFHKLDLEKCGDVYSKILHLTECCGMVIHVPTIVNNALDALHAQTGRQDALSHIEIGPLPEETWICPAAAQTLTRCILRILDNAMSQQSRVMICAEITRDELVGQTFLTFRIYDTNAFMPEPIQYGLGLRGVLQEMTAFDGGFRFRLEEKEAYRKAAILSIPVFPYKAVHIERTPPWRRMVFIFVNALSIFLIILTINRIIGGPPVEFAGKGITIIEFPIEVGNELVIPLCKGGTHVRATLDIDENAACREGNCSLYRVLEDLKACASGINNPDCPGELRWTPQFDDGQRLGKSYEITVNCISEGPPKSETSDHIRILVSRPNKAPEVIQVQIENMTSSITSNITRGPVGIAANDQIRLHAVAIDLDSDLIQYTLHYPDGTSHTSFDGFFTIEPSWGMFTSWNAELEISDNIAPPIRIPIQLRATKLHPIELRDISVWHHQSKLFMGCYSITDTQHLCNFDSAISNDISIAAWFDPLLKRVRPKFIFEPAEMLNYDIKYHPKNDTVSESQIGDQWEIHHAETGQTIAFIELMRMEKTTHPGIYHFIFNIMTNPDFTQSETKSTTFPLTIHLTDLSNRLPEYAAFVLFTYHSAGRSEASFVTKHIKLKEYAAEEHASDAKSFITFYGIHNDLKPSFGKFSCSRPEFESAFEPIGFKHNSTGWRIDFNLKPGCIPGLTSTLDNRERLCSLEVFTDAEKKHAETIWITLEDRACPPVIDHLELISTPEERAQNDFKWQFRILDSDGDLEPENIEFTSPAEDAFNLLIETDQTYAGSAYRGVFRTKGVCLKDMQDRFLSATDATGLFLRRRISLPLNCPPLVQMITPLNHVDIDEGEELRLPLSYDSDVTPRLLSSVGKIEKGVFIWKADCHYGDTPIPVSIQGDSKTRIGATLQFDIHVRHCFPKFILQAGGVLQDMSKLVIPKGQTRTVTVSSTSGNLSKYLYDSHLEDDTPNITFDSELNDTWKLTIQCHDDHSENTLWLHARPDDDVHPYLFHEPQKIHIRCVPQ